MATSEIWKPDIAPDHQSPPPDPRFTICDWLILGFDIAFFSTAAYIKLLAPIINSYIP